MLCRGGPLPSARNVAGVWLRAAERPQPLVCRATNQRLEPEPNGLGVGPGAGRGPSLAQKALIDVKGLFHTADPTILVWYFAGPVSGVAIRVGDTDDMGRVVVRSGGRGGGQAEQRQPMLTELGMRVRDVQQGPDGYLYLATEAQYGSGKTDGALLRLEPAGCRVCRRGLTERRQTGDVNLGGTGDSGNRAARMRDGRRQGRQRCSRAAWRQNFMAK